MTGSRLVPESTLCGDYRPGAAGEAQTGHAKPNEHEVNEISQDHRDIAFEVRTGGAVLRQDGTCPQSASQPEALSTCGQSVEVTSNAREVTDECCDTNIIPGISTYKSVDAIVNEDQHVDDLSLLASTADESLARQTQQSATDGLDTGRTPVSGTHRGYAPQSFGFETDWSSGEQAVPQMPMPSAKGTATFAGQGSSQTPTTTASRSAGSVSEHLDLAAGIGNVGDLTLVSPMNQQSDSDFAALWGAPASSGEDWEQGWDEWLPPIFDLSFFADLPPSSSTPTGGTQWDR